jgi:hypothetical protein
MSQQHTFQGQLSWTGTAVEPEPGKLKLTRSFVLRFGGKTPIEGSSRRFAARAFASPGRPFGCRRRRS